MQYVVGFFDLSNAQIVKQLAFLPSFKNLVRTEFKKEIQKGQISYSELDDLFTDIDTLMLIAFDLYSESKELLYNLRIAQTKLSGLLA